MNFESMEAETDLESKLEISLSIPEKNAEKIARKLVSENKIQNKKKKSKDDFEPNFKQFLFWKLIKVTILLSFIGSCKLIKNAIVPAYKASFTIKYKQISCFMLTYRLMFLC